ncbi:MAG: iron-sulfur cluster-binding domain-containing protein, partial [Planctomycetaceae bacterium]
MMATLPQALEDWGVPSSRIFMEAFGPASTPKKKRSVTNKETQTSSSSAVKVKFNRTGKEVAWTDDFNNLLEMAETLGLQIDSGCRAGNCGTCEVALLEGAVSYVHAGAEIADGSCLACISLPDGDVVLDM